MKSRNFFGALSLIIIGTVFGAILVSSFGWVRPGMAEVRIGAENAPVASISMDAAAVNDQFVQVAEMVTPSIVQIRVITTAKTNFEDSPFKFFFDHPDLGERKEQGGGSGVIISNDGYILTNNHVVENAEKVTVTLSTKETFEAVVVGTDPLTDLAVVKIDNESLPEVYFGNSDKLHVGQWVMAIGNPLGYLTSTVTAGIVSARGRNLQLIRDAEGYGIEDFIQTDAVINPGNSGGALVDLSGAVVGINTAIATNGFSRNYIGYGFAIPINIAKTVAEDLIAYGKVHRGYIGVRIKEVDDALAKAVGLEKPMGILITDIVPDGSAATEDIQAGDIILKVDERELYQPNELQSYIATKRAGTAVTLELFRDGDKIKRTVTLKSREGELKENPVAAEKKSEKKDTAPREVSFKEIGLTVKDISDKDKDSYDVSNGVMILNVERFSPASDQNLQPGFIITEVNKSAVKSTNEFKEMIEDNRGKAVLMRVVMSKDNVNFVGLEIPK